MLLTDVKKALKSQGFNQLAKMLKKTNFEFLTVSSLKDEFGLTTLTGMSEDELGEKDSIKCFEENFLTPVKHYLKLIITPELNDFTLTNLKFNASKLMAELEEIINPSPLLLNSLDVDNYLTNLTEEGKFGGLVVKGERTYVYLFPRKLSIPSDVMMDKLNKIISDEKTNDPKYAKFLQDLQDAFKDNRQYLYDLDNNFSKRALYDKQARKDLVKINSLRVWFD